MSVGAYRALRSAPIVFVRTSRHPAVEELTSEGVAFRSFDYLYDSAGTFEEVYLQIARRVLEEAERGDVVYAVPGHPLVGESSVSLLIGEARKKGVAGQEIQAAEQDVKRIMDFCTDDYHLMSNTEGFTYNGGPERWGDDWFYDHWRSLLRRHIVAITDRLSQHLPGAKAHP